MTRKPDHTTYPIVLTILIGAILLAIGPVHAAKGPPNNTPILRPVVKKPDFVCIVTISDHEGNPDTWKKEMFSTKNPYFYVTVKTTNQGGPAASPVDGHYNLSGPGLGSKNVGFTVAKLGAGESNQQSFKEPFSGNSCQPTVKVLINGGKYVPESNYTNNTASWICSVAKAP